MICRVSLLAVLSGALAAAQDAQISGLISDPSKAGLAGADIALRNEQTGGRRSIQSNDLGFYSFSALRPGVYRLTVRAAGFETVVREGIVLEVGQSARLDFNLQIGVPQTTVTVSSAPPPVSLEDAAVGTVIDRNLIDKMPLNGRGIQTLIELAPGVNAVPVTDFSRGQFSINGQRSDANYFAIDGISVNFAAGNTNTINANNRAALPTIGQAGGGMLPAINFLGTFSNLLAPDALQEFKIQTSTYAPEFGHLPGGQIDLVSRSGANRYAASLFEYLRNDKTDANDWFNNAKSISKPPLRFNNFGGSVGGPVTVGRWYNGRNRTFFFLSVDQLLASQPQPPVIMGVPSASARQNAPAVLARLLDLFPLPNGGPGSEPGFAFYSGASSHRYMQGSYGLRVDHSLSKNVNVFARVNHAPSRRDEPIQSFLDASSLPIAVGSPSNFERYRIDTDVLTLGVTQVFTPSMVNEFRFGAGHQATADRTDVNTVTGSGNPGIDQIFPPGFSASDSNIELGVHTKPASLMFVGLVQKNQSSQLEAADNLFYARGTHRWKFGGDYRAFRITVIEPRFTGVVGLPGIYGPDGSFISAATSASALIYPQPKTAYLDPSFSAYVQDTWRITETLTATYGVRWEVASAPRTIEGVALVADGSTKLNDPSSVSFIPQGKPFYPATYANFAPRLGLAWQIFAGPSKATVLRVGAGQFFSSAQGGFQDSASGPSAQDFYTNPPLESLFSGTPSATGRPIILAVAAAPHYRLPVTYQWNATIEQRLGAQTMSIGYVGALGRRLVDYALAPSSSAGMMIFPVGNDASSSYHSLQLQFNRRLPGKLQVLASYTWSHSIDTLSNDVGLAYGLRVVVPYNPLNPNGDRGPSDFDIRHSLRGAVIAQLPSPRQGAWAAALGHWSAESIFFARSAPPTDLVSISSANGRPNYVYGAPLYLYGSQYPGGKRYNPDAFVNPAKDENGNFGRNVLRGFGAWQIDFALHREIRLSEGTRLQFRAEAFNVLNHPNFTNPNYSGAPGFLYFDRSPGFGLSTRTLASGLGPSSIPGELNPLFQIGGPRVVQFAVRFLH